VRGRDLLLLAVLSFNTRQTGVALVQGPTLRVELPDGRYGDGGRGAVFFREAFEMVMKGVLAAPADDC
jgi:hypothetical protein